MNRSWTRPRGLRIGFCVGALFLLLASVQAAPPSRQLLPATTKFSLSIPDTPDFNRRFDQTQLGQLLADPALKPFLDDLPRQFKNEAAGEHPLANLSIDLGVGWNEVRAVPSGELAWGLIHDEHDKPARVLIADVAGRREQLDSLLQRIAASMTEQQAKKSQQTLGGTELTIYNIPAAGKVPRRTVVHFLKNDLFVAAENTATAQRLLNAIESPPADSLAQNADYQQVMNQCRADAGDLPPQAVVYLVPVDLGESLRELGAAKAAGGIDRLAVARKQNFDAVKALGAFVHLDDGDYDFFCRIAAYAPKPWKGSMRICQFPNGQPAPAAWISDDSPAVSLLRVDFPTAAQFVGPLFDDVYGEGEEGLYEDIRMSLLEDPDGPKIDINKELFSRLSPQVSFVARDQLPVTPDSPQKVIAIATTDEKGLAVAVKKTLEGYGDIEPGTVAGREAFFGYEADAQTREVPAFVACVANGHLFLATDVAALEHALAGESRKPLAGHADYQRLLPHWRGLGDDVSYQQFCRMQDSLQVSYELFRQGKAPSPKKTYRGLIQNLVAGETQPPKMPKIDGSKLPPFDAVKKYFGLAGMVGKTTDTGWFLHGFVLKK